jgi:hypothetical protein
LHFNIKEVQLLGEKQRSEPMFYYVRMEDIVPEGHLLRVVDQYIDFGFEKDKRDTSHIF